MANRFRSEIRLARKVSSPHVCRIYEYGVDGDLHYISMEYVDGVTLKDLLRESGGLPVDVALDIAAQIVVGLAAIHDAGIMHRDVKPANLMRTAQRARQAHGLRNRQADRRESPSPRRARPWGRRST